MVWKAYGYPAHRSGGFSVANAEADTDRKRRQLMDMSDFRGHFGDIDLARSGNSLE